MITSVADERIKDVRVTDDELVVALADGRTLSVPLVWYPRLLNASAEQRGDWELIGDGEGVHWPQIDEDLSAAGMLRGIPAPAVRLPSASAREIKDQTVSRSAQDYYGHSLGKLKGQLQGDRSQLENLAEQVPQEEVQAQIQEMIDSYTATEEAIDQAAQDLGVQDMVNQEAQQAQDTAQGAAQQAQEIAGQAVGGGQGVLGQMSDLVGQATQGVQETAGQAAGQAQETAGGAVQQAQDAAEGSAQQAQETAGATKKKPIHVTPRDDGWAVMREGNQRASSVHSTQKEAEKVGRQAARKEKTEFFLHNRQGQIRERESYGSDPRSSKG
jgi:hypothetical protein